MPGSRTVYRPREISASRLRIGSSGDSSRSETSSSLSKILWVLLKDRKTSR